MSGVISHVIEVRDAGSDQVNGLYRLHPRSGQRDVYFGPNGHCIVLETKGRYGWRLCALGDKPSLLRRDLYRTYALSKQPPPHGWAVLDGDEPGPIVRTVEEMKLPERTQGAQAWAPKLPPLTASQSLMQSASLPALGGTQTLLSAEDSGPMPDMDLPSVPCLRCFRVPAFVCAQLTPAQGEKGLLRWGQTPFTQHGTHVVKDVASALDVLQQGLPWELQIRPKDLLLRIDGEVMHCGQPLKGGEACFEFGRAEALPGVPWAPRVAVVGAGELAVTWGRPQGPLQASHAAVVAREVKATGKWTPVYVDDRGIGTLPKETDAFEAGGLVGRAVPSTQQTCVLSGLSAGRKYELAYSVLTELGWSPISLATTAKLPAQVKQHRFGKTSGATGKVLTMAMGWKQPAKPQEGCAFTLPLEVLPGRTAPLSAPRAPRFVVALPRSETRPRLGLGLVEDRAQHALVVQEVRAGGRVEKWNALMLSHDDPQRVVRAGDRLVQVNAAQGDPGAMLHAAQTEEVTLLTVVRDVVELKQRFLRWERNCVLTREEHAVQHALLGDKVDKVEDALAKLPKGGDATAKALRADAEARVRYLKSLGDGEDDPKMRQMVALELMDALEDKARTVERLGRALDMARTQNVSEQLIAQGEVRMKEWQRLQDKKQAKAKLEATLKLAPSAAPTEAQVALGESLSRAQACGLGGELLHQAQRAFDEARFNAEREAAAEQLQAALKRLREADPDGQLALGDPQLAEEILKQLSEAIARGDAARCDAVLVGRAEMAQQALHRQQVQAKAETELSLALAKLKATMDVPPPWPSNSAEPLDRALRQASRVGLEAKVVADAELQREMWDGYAVANETAAELKEMLRTLNQKSTEDESVDDKIRETGELLEEYFDDHPLLEEADKLLDKRFDLRITLAKLQLAKALKDPTEAALQKALDDASKCPGMEEHVVEQAEQAAAQLKMVRTIEDRLATGIRERSVDKLNASIREAHDKLGGLAYDVHTLRPAERCREELLVLHELEVAIEKKDRPHLVEEIADAERILGKRSTAMEAMDKHTLCGTRAVAQWEMKCKQDAFFLEQELAEMVQKAKKVVEAIDHERKVTEALQDTKGQNVPKHHGSRLQWLNNLLEHEADLEPDVYQQLKKDRDALEAATSELKTAIEKAGKHGDRAVATMEAKMKRAVEMEVEASLVLQAQKVLNQIHAVRADHLQRQFGLERALKSGVDWSLPYHSRLKTLQEVVAETRQFLERSKEKAPALFPPCEAMLEWIQNEPGLRQSERDLRKAAAESVGELATLSTMIAQANQAVLGALAQGFPDHHDPIVDCREAIQIATHVQDERAKAEEQLQAAVRSKRVGQLRKCLVKAKAQKVFEKMLGDARMEMAELQRQECVEDIRKAMDENELGRLAALVAHYDRLEVAAQDLKREEAERRGICLTGDDAKPKVREDGSVELLTEARDLVAHTERSVANGRFHAHAGPFDTAAWRNNEAFRVFLGGDEEERVARLEREAMPDFEAMAPTGQNKHRRRSSCFGGGGEAKKRMQEDAKKAALAKHSKETGAIKAKPDDIRVTFYLEDTGQGAVDEIELHVVLNAPEVADMVPPTLLPGCKVLASAHGSGMVQLTVHVPRGHAVLAVPSVKACPATYQDHEPSTREGNFVLSCVSAHHVELQPVQPSVWTFHTRMWGEWSVVAKSAGGPMGRREPLHNWYRNPQFRVYVGSELERNALYAQLKADDDPDPEGGPNAAAQAALKATLTDDKGPKTTVLGVLTWRVDPHAVDTGTVANQGHEGREVLPKREQPGAELHVVKNKLAAQQYHNVFHSVIPNSVNHQVLSGAGGKLECCTALDLPVSALPVFFTPSLSQPKTHGIFTLDVFATAEIKVERVGATEN